MFKTTAYRNIGFCIYCGSTRPPLTREHVIPRGLTGKHKIYGAHTAAVLGKASCEKCRRITHEFETVCQRKMLGHLRSRMGLVRDKASDFVTGNLIFADGATRQITARPDEFAASLVLPLFARNPLLFLSPGVEQEPVREWIYKVIFEPSDPHPFGARESAITYDLDINAYQRMLAKIGLGAAILKHGTDFFTPLVCDFIRGDEQAIGKYVFGFDLEKERALHMGEAHSIKLREHERNGIKYIVAFVRLFAIYGGPTNGVLVGVVKENAPKLVKIGQYQHRVIKT